MGSILQYPHSVCREDDRTDAAVLTEYLSEQSRAALIVATGKSSAGAGLHSESGRKSRQVPRSQTQMLRKGKLETVENRRWGARRIGWSKVRCMKYLLNIFYGTHRSV